VAATLRAAALFSRLAVWSFLRAGWLAVWSVLVAVWSVTAEGCLAVWFVAAAGCGAVRRQIRVVVLRRKVRKLEDAECKFLVQLGLRLLSDRVTVPNAQGLEQRFRHWNSTHQFAQLAVKDEDTVAKGELRKLFADYARFALLSLVHFEGRPAKEAEWRQLLS